MSSQAHSRELMEIRSNVYFCFGVRIVPHRKCTYERTGDSGIGLNESLFKTLSHNSQCKPLIIFETLIEIEITILPTSIIQNLQQVFLLLFLLFITFEI